MPDITIKTIVTPSPSPASSTVASATNGATKVASNNTDMPEAASPSGTEQNGLASALQRQLDKQSADGEPTATGDAAAQAGDAAAVSITAPIDLGTLLGSLQASPVQPQTAVEVLTPPASDVGAVALVMHTALGSIHPSLTHEKASEEKLQAEPALVTAAPADKPAVLAASDVMKVATLASTPDEPKQMAAEAQIEGPLATQTPTLHSVPNTIAHPGEPAQSTLPSLRMETPLKAPGWQDELGQKLTLLVGREQHRAEIVLNPPQLGRVEVTLTVSNDQASAQFIAATPAARDALEQAVPRLREVLAEAGIALGQASVNEESSQGQGYSGQRGERKFQSAVPLTSMEPVWIRRTDGLVDTFA